VRFSAYYTRYPSESEVFSSVEIRISHICIFNVITAKPQANLVYSLEDSPLTYELNPFSMSMPSKCNPFLYSVKLLPNKDLPPNLATFEPMTRELRVSSPHLRYEGEHLLVASGMTIYYDDEKSLTSEVSPSMSRVYLSSCRPSRVVAALRLRPSSLASQRIWCLPSRILKSSHCVRGLIRSPTLSRSKVGRHYLHSLRLMKKKGSSMSLIYRSYSRRP
jgi:hypothetical protein